MRIFASVTEVGQALKGGAVAVGNFDGIHLGHQALLKQAREVATGFAGVLTFTPHPREILSPKDLHFCLSSDVQRAHIFAQFGLEVAVFHRLTRQFLHLAPQQFIDDILVSALKISDLVVGHDFRFGAGAQGDVELLRAPHNATRFLTHVVSPVFCEGQRCSSSTIRQLLGQGELALSRKMLGRDYSVDGMVERGDGRGAQLGFRTANIVPKAGFGLSRGVYATVVRVDSPAGPRDFVACTNVGLRPSISLDGAMRVESHLLDAELDLYGQRIEVFFIERLRDELKFPTLKSLAAQVQTDLQATRQMWHRSPHRFQPSS